MENSGKTFSGIIPLDILDELFYLIAGEENLKGTSLVCPRWRYLSQRELFAAVQVDPVLSHGGVYQVATPPHAHLAPHIKKVQIMNLSRANSDPKLPFQCSPQFMGLLRALPALETMDFCHPHLDWFNIPEGTLNGFLEVVSRPSFRALEVSDGKKFPIPVFLHRTNVDTLVMMDTKCLAFLSHTESASPFETRLTSLGLLDPATITTFAAFFYRNTPLAQGFRQNLTQLTLKYVECCVFPSLDPGTIMKILSIVGTSLESLKIEASWPFAAPARPLDFRALINLRQLHLSFAVPFPREQNEILTYYVIPVILSLPMPQSLVEFSLALNYYVQGFPIIDDCTRPFRVLESLIEPVFMDAKWIGLKRVGVYLQLSRGTEPPIQTRPVTKPLRRLESRNISVEAFTRA